MGNASLELDKTMGPRPANSIRDRSLIDGLTKVRMYGCNLILRQPSLRNALQGGSDHVSYPHSTRRARVDSEELNWDSAGSAMAYIHFAQILYSANRTSGPSGPKIKPRK